MANPLKSVSGISREFIRRPVHAARENIRHRPLSMLMQAADTA
jgi:hypothetical protein